MKAATVFLSVGLLTSLLIAGCSERTEQAAETAARSAAQDTERNLEKAGQAVEGAVEGAAQATQEGAQTATWTTKVKSALAADPAVHAHDLNVDTQAETNTVIITGSAHTEGEKARITEIAREAVDGKATIQNNVVVSGTAEAH